MLYIDVDAFCKLAHWNILPFLPDLVGRGWDDMATPSSLRYRSRDAQENPDGKIFHCIDAARTAYGCILKMGSPHDSNIDILNALNDAVEIDTGEAVLLATTANDPHGCFLTGDKRALRALSRHTCSQFFVGRIIMLEQILWLCFQNRGREWLLENICPYRHIDAATSIILGSRCDGSAESIETGIRSYIRDITQMHDPSLFASIP